MTPRNIFKKTIKNLSRLNFDYLIQFLIEGLYLNFWLGFFPFFLPQLSFVQLMDVKREREKKRGGKKRKFWDFTLIKFLSGYERLHKRRESFSQVMKGYAKEEREREGKN